MYVVKSVLQIGLLLAIALLSNSLMQLLHWNFPGSILGIFIVFILLQTKLLRLEWIESGANCLIAELMLFFIPSAVGVIQYKQMMLVEGMRFELVILLSTLTVMVCTGLLVEAIHLWEKRKG